MVEAVVVFIYLKVIIVLVLQKKRIVFQTAVEF